MQKTNSKEMEESSFLTLMPEEILLHMTNFLSFRDVINLSRTSKWMKSVLPRFKLHIQKINGPDFKEHGAYAPHWNPLHYFDSPKFESAEHWKFHCVQKVTVTMTWNDQVGQVVKQRFSNA